MNKEIADRLNVLADLHPHNNFIAKELRGLAKLLTEGKEVGSCPYCKRGTLVIVDGKAVNIGEMGRHDCCCADLVIPFWQWTTGEI